MKTKRIIGLFLVALMLLSLFVACTPKRAESDMDITFVVTSLDGSVNETKKVRAHAGDTAWELFKANFDVEYEDSQYGPSIKGINGVMTDWSTSYFALYVDDAYATTGIDGIAMKDGMKISWIEEKCTW